MNQTANQAIIDKILYLTHDRFTDRIAVKNRDHFEEYLKLFLEFCPEVISIYKEVIYYGEDAKGLVIQKGVMELLKQKYPLVHQRVLLKQRFLYNQSQTL